MGIGSGASVRGCAAMIIRPPLIFCARREHDVEAWFVTMRFLCWLKNMG